MTTPDLPTAIAMAAETLYSGHLRTLADRIAEHATPSTAGAITKQPPVAAYTTAAQRILDAWRADPGAATGSGIALALRSALATREKIQSGQKVQLAWTGPDSKTLQARPTSEIITGVIDSARGSLLLVSYATFRVDPVVKALQQARNRGVAISLLLENRTASEGQLKPPAVDSFADIDATTYEWANPERPRVSGNPAVMHAKIALADDHTAFITSANLTGKALDHNMEAGILITGGPIPKTLHQHFRDLVYGGIVVPVAE